MTSKNLNETSSCYWRLWYLKQNYNEACIREILIFIHNFPVPCYKITILLERHWQCQFYHVFIIIITCFQMYFNRINIVNSLNKIWYRHYNQQNKCTRACEPSKINERFISHSSSWIRILWNIKYYYYQYKNIFPCLHAYHLPQKSLIIYRGL